MGLIYVDACLVIYAFEDHALFGPQARSAFKRALPGQLAISPLVKLECLVAPMRTGNLVLQRYYEQGLARFALLQMPEEVFPHAAALRARFGLRTPDALHLATAQYHVCEALWTNDDRLAKAAHGMAVNVFA